MYSLFVIHCDNFTEMKALLAALMLMIPVNLALQELARVTLEVLLEVADRVLGEAALFAREAVALTARADKQHVLTGFEP